MLNPESEAALQQEAALPSDQRPRLVHLALGVLLGLSACFLLAAAFNSGGRIAEIMDQRQIIGTCLLFILAPTYLLTLQAYQRWRGPLLLAGLADRALKEDLDRAVRRYRSLNRKHAFVAIAVGMIFGFSQNRFVLAYLFGDAAVSTLDLAFLFGNALLWAIVLLILAWKLSVSLALQRLGAHVKVDVYQLNRLRSLGVLAALDVLAVAGGLILMPLQALDAEFRMENYQWGLLIGIPAAIALFLLPLLGVRRQIRQAKAQRLAELDALQTAINQDDVAQLELFEAHRHRIEGLPNWPIDIQLVFRILVYVVLPPLAWIAAALVEQVVERFS